MTLIPFRPNWSSPVTHTWSYLTEILTSRSGREQRRALRAEPRRSIGWSAVTPLADLQAFRRIMAASQAVELAVADELRYTSLASAAAQGSDEVALGDIPSWLTEGATVVLVNPVDESREHREVASIAVNIVTFATDSAYAWPAGARVHPALSGRLANPVTSRRVTNHLATIALQFDETPGSAPAVDVGEPELEFNGREILVHRPNWSSPLEVQDLQATEAVDFKTGLRSIYAPVAFPQEIVRSQHLIRSDAHLNQVLGLFHRCKGRRGEFYQPSGLADLILAAAVADGSSTMRVAGAAVAAAYDDHPIYRAIEVRLTSGENLYFTVESIAADGDESVLTIGDPAPQVIDPNDVLMISWMPVVRFVSDDLTIEWITDRLARATLNTTTIESDPG